MPRHPLVIAALAAALPLAVAHAHLKTCQMFTVHELLQVARDNIVRWRAQGQTAPHRLEQWEQILIDAQGGEPGMRHLMNVLLGTEEENERLREFSPFPGILTREERRQAWELCGYRH